MASPLYFYGHTGDTGFLSNFFPCSFSMNLNDGTNQTYVSAEQAIMHHKAMLMGDKSTADAIMKAIAPMEAKRLGRRVSPWNEELWATQRPILAYNVLSAKFTQNSQLMEKLRATAPRLLVEAAPRDRIWGIGIGKARAEQGDEWRGMNLLGNTLTRVRDDHFKKPPDL